MALKIETFSNVKGGNAFYKAVCHPLAGAKAVPFLAEIAAAGPVALYDPLGLAQPFSELYDLTGLDLAGIYVQDIDDLGRVLLGQATQPITDLKAAAVTTLLVVAFDAERLISHIEHLLPKGAKAVSLDPLRLPAEMLTNQRNYLDPLNFATNFAFFREADGHHTRLVSANYWSGYGAKSPRLWCCLFDGDGSVLAEWSEDLPGAGGGFSLDSAELRERFELGDFTGQLFIHVMGVAGHDIVKYALDTYGDDASVLSCTHDANAWPSDRYAGLPAPRAGEQVILWLQNSHPRPIPAGEIAMNRMGRRESVTLDRAIPGFGTYPLDTRELLPDTVWPEQIEIVAGKHMVRPRYEVVGATGRRRIAHVNVERGDLKPDRRIPELANLMGKGFILPAPVLPPERFRSILLPTPMATGQTSLPITALVYDQDGHEVAAEPLGDLPRDHALALDVSDRLRANGAAKNGDGGHADGLGWSEGGWGHIELVYDFRDGGEADGWLHGLFRYEDKHSGHGAETSFGAHVFNSVLVYKSEPQSYGSRAPGLSTRLFLRLGPAPYGTLCHLIYPASTPWHATSETRLGLHGADGAEIDHREVAIPCGGSLLWSAGEVFGAEALAEAGPGASVLVRDTTCRLFGYHGLMHGRESFSFDHMFGF